MTAAPAANPSRPSINAIAALDMGAVSDKPIMVATKIDITKGCCSVDQFISAPSEVIKLLIGIPTNAPT